MFECESEGRRLVGIDITEGVKWSVLFGEKLDLLLTRSWASNLITFLTDRPASKLDVTLKLRMACEGTTPSAIHATASRSPPTTGAPINSAMPNAY